MGSSVGALHDILLPAHPFSSTMSAGKQYGAQRSSIEPPCGAHQPPAKAVTSPKRPGTLPDPAGRRAPPPPSKTMPKMQGGGARSITAGPCPLLLFAIIFTGLPLPLRSIPRKLGVSTPGAATSVFVLRLGASSAPTAPPKGLTRAGKLALPMGGGRVVAAWGLVGFGYPTHPLPRGGCPPPRRDVLPQQGR